MASEKKLRIGIIGAGAIAQACHLPGYVKLENAELVAFADPEQARHKEMADFYPEMKPYAHYAHMLANEKLDVVSVCTPNKYHADAAIAALEAKCHVLCERPISTTLEEADAMIEAAKKARKKLMVGFTHRLFEGPSKCKELLEQKAIGKPFMMRVRFAHGGPYPGWAKSDWFYNKDMAAGGVMLDVGIHAIDLCLWLMGPIVSVDAKAATLVKRIEVDDNALLLVQFKSGALGSVEVGWTSKPGFTGFEIYGTEGSIICDYQYGLKLCEGKPSAGKENAFEWSRVVKKPTEGGWSAEIAHWMDVVTGEQRLTMNGKAGREALEVALAAYKSNETGKRVALPMN